MSNSVDNRVVQMGFDNKQFESGVQQTVKSLDSLKEGLKLDQSAKSLANLENVSKGFSLEGISKGVDHISSRFSALGVVGFTVIQNLTNAAINYGRKLVSQLTTPMRTGFQEYETQMNAIQTVLANTQSKGTTLNDVNEALNTLNTYADKTIYNFTEMTRNIGTFTAAGVDLETSVDAIKGIANLAAVSGSNSQQASTAMYQLSQALSSGTVKLMDWNSVVNAGMGGQVFQEALMETARVHGIAIDKMIKSEGSFRETLSNGWLTSDVLLETLQKFTGDLSKEQLLSMGYAEDQIDAILQLGKTANDAATKVKTLTQLQDTLAEAMQSGWTQSWQIIVGDFEEAKSLFTFISDTIGAMIGDSANARNAVLQSWKDMGGRTKAVQAIKNAFIGIIRITKPIKDAMREIFGPGITGRNLYDLTSALTAFTEKLKISGDTANKIKRIFKGLFAILDIFKFVVVSIVTALFNLGSGFDTSNLHILDFLANIGDYLVRVRDTIKTTDVFANAINRVKDFLIEMSKAVSNFASAVKTRFQEVKKWFTDTFGQMFKGIDTSGATTFLDNIKLKLEPLKKLGTGVMYILGGLLKVAQFIAPILFKVGVVIANFAKNIGTKIVEAIKALDLRKLFSLINSGLIAALILAVKKFVDSGGGVLEEAGGVFGGITEILDGVRGSLEAWQQNLKAKTLLTIALAIGVLAASLVVISQIDPQKLVTSLAAITAMFIQLVAAQGAFNAVGGKSNVKATSALIALAAAVLIMSFAVAKLSKLDPDEIGQGLGAVLALSAGLVAISKLMDKNSKGILKTSVGLMAFSIALSLIANVVKKLGGMKPDVLTQGLTSVGIMLAEIAAFLKLADFGKMGVSKGVGLIAVAGAIMVLSVAVEKFGNMDIGKLQVGLQALGVVLAEIGIFTRLTGNGKGMISIGIGMTIIAASMLIFNEAIMRMGSLSLETIGKGLGTMAGALALIFAAVKLMPKSIVLIAPMLLVVSGAMVVMAYALGQMANMSWEEIGKGLATLAGTLALLTVALYAMSGSLAGSAALVIAAGALMMLTPVLKILGGMQITEIAIALGALAGVFLILGIAGYALTPAVPTLFGLAGAMLLLGVAAALVGAGLLAFSAGLAAIAVSGVAGAVAIVAMISTILGIVPVIVQTLIDTIILFGQGIIEAAPVIALAIEALLLGILDIIIKVSPKLFQGLTILLKGLLQLIRDVIPDFLDTVSLLITELLNLIVAKVPEFVKAGIEILLGFLKGIRDNINEITEVAIDIVTQFIDSVASKLPDIIDSGFNLIVQFINGLADGVRQNGPELQKAIGNLTDAIITGFTNGILAGTGSVISAIGRLAGAAVSALKTLLGIFSPSKVFDKLGGYTTMGFVKGLLRYGTRVASATKDVGSKAIDGMSSAISRINDVVNDNLDANPTIRPVVDLTDVISGADAINSALSKQQFNIVPTISKLATVASTAPGAVYPQQAAIPSTGNSISFTQNNYSPKELSAIEIYRQTKTQLLTLKGLVNPS